MLRAISRWKLIFFTLMRLWQDCWADWYNLWQSGISIQLSVSASVMAKAYQVQLSEIRVSATLTRYSERSVIRDRIGSCIYRQGPLALGISVYFYPARIHPIHPFLLSLLSLPQGPQHQRLFIVRITNTRYSKPSFEPL